MKRFLLLPLISLMWPTALLGAEIEAEKYTDKPIVKETRWSRERLIGEKEFWQESKFRIGQARISLVELQREWPLWDVHEQLDFANSYQRIPDANFDRSIARFLAEQTNINPLARVAVCYSTSRLGPVEGFDYLSKWAQSESTPEPAKANIFQCLTFPSLAKVKPKAIVLMDKLLDQYLRDKRVWQNNSDHRAKAFTTCASELYRLTGKEKYRNLLLRLSHHPEPVAASWARAALNTK